MRSITSYLNEKLISTQQTPANKADPKMSIKVSRARTTVMDTDYWTVETIRTGDNLGDISLAARRRLPYGSPDSIYEIHVEGGLVKTSIRNYPDFFKLGWQPQFELGEGISVAIAFNGNWQLYRKRWRLTTDEKPFIFWVDNQGILWSQLWDQEETIREIASSVVKVKAIRGWKNVNFPDKDQGVIVSYIKTDGKVYYSSYCQNVDYTYLWEPERQLTDFSGTAVSLNIFITNDYRMGFAIEDSSMNVHWLVTHRNWAGMAIPSHSIAVMMSDTRVAMTELDFLTGFAPDEYIKVVPAEIQQGNYYNDVSNRMVVAYNVDNGSGDWGRIIEFDTLHPLYNVSAGNFIVQDAVYGMVIPIGLVEKVTDVHYRLTVQEQNLVGINNATGGIKLTVRFISNPITGLAQDQFEFLFTPTNLVPVYIPLPEVEVIWNE